MKNIDIIRSASEEDLIEILNEKAFDCDERCPDFGCGCMEKCEHDCGRDFIRDWLNAENYYLQTLKMQKLMLSALTAELL